MAVREWVRRTVPFSSEAYEWSEHEYRSMIGKRRVRDLQKSGDPLWIDLGGGAKAGRNGWLTLDVTRQCDIYWDLRKGIPFSEGRVERLYSSHLFEHLPFRAGQALMAEALRVLTPGGSFSICVPNAGMYIRAYAEGRQLPDEYFGWRSAYNDTTRIDAVNYTAYMDGHHLYMFDEENLVKRLELAGFEGVSLRDFDPETDIRDRDFESIYAIGYKPSR